ncbi:ATP-grasp domain containing protein [Leishmania donovani]|uniref:ATP-grasp_domain_containing_protein_-_putative n=3 Tax=Leishmania donovani species complex TaxID=38574 RepID=A0A6L0XRS7_LEIIN|nr:conserved hypothetical protein [Leishmania infantum JPCM5]TPP48096.1 ATP-grasp domain family protein [Leishmania donovani]CAC9544753.1 ATP-grasp_domain_containing_protein_-_putative [Leishmania infantum]CAJ1993039.1 ATP-grasp domain containing protein [Leishmania donovani]CAM72134.1 conserved hypothetical protein [Leishmania infantum JPCM5]SUZ46056.1 ATP-grasp_domain_containing_protein_-_putative [Leishmania infantum]|eukprot:XP_001469037.1 conserved hypothetical protein [Leishmania infantum JPCM5]
MDGKVIVFLRTSSVARLPLYRRLRSLNVALVLVHPFTPLPAFDGVFSHWLQHETSDVDEVHLALSAFLASRGLVPDAVVSFDEYAVYQAALIAARLNLTPIPLPPAAVLQNNMKDLFRLFCSEHGIPSPKSVPLPVAAALPTPGEMSKRARDADALSMAFEKARPALIKTISKTIEAAALAFPVVLKPSPGAGSLLTRLCSTLDDAVAHVWYMWTMLASHPDTRHFAALTKSAAAGPVREEGAAAVHILAEEFIEGQEVDMDCVVEHGVVRFCSISDNFEPSLPYFAEVGGICPSQLGHRGQCALRELLDLYVSAHGAHLHGVIHFEAKYDPARQRAYVIEVNCRPGSAETNVMVQTVYRGLNLGEALVRCALQMPIQEQLAGLFPELLAGQQEEGGVQMLWQTATPPRHSEADANEGIPISAARTAVWSLLGGPSRGFFPPQCWAASVNIYPNQAGVLSKARVPVEDASLVAFSVSARPGEAVAPPPKQFYMLCWMVVRGATDEEAKANIWRVTSTFEQEVAPPF